MIVILLSKYWGFSALASNMVHEERLLNHLNATLPIHIAVSNLSQKQQKILIIKGKKKTGVKQINKRHECRRI